MYISLPALHDYDVKLPKLTFYGGRELNTTIFVLLFELKYSPLEFNFWKIANIWQIKGVGIRAMKFKTTQIQFLADVFAAVAVFVV